MAGPLRMIDQLLDVVANRSFMPDATRSGRWNGQQKVGLFSGSAAVDEDDEEAPVELGKDSEKDDDVAGGWPKFDVQEQPQGVCIFPACRTSRCPGMSGMECYSCRLSGCSACFPLTLTDDGDVLCDSCRVSGDLGGKESVAAEFDSTSDSSFSEKEVGGSSESDCQIVRAEVSAAKACGLARKPAKGSSKAVFQHPVLKTLHLGREGSTGLACGRPSETFWSLQELPAFDFHRCRVCFGDHTAEDEDSDDAEREVKQEDPEDAELVGSESEARPSSPGGSRGGSIYE